jgi:phage tail-like protein
MIEVNKMPTVGRNNWYRKFRFLIELEGLIVGGFSEVSGLQVENEVETIGEGNFNNYESKFPKNTKYPNIVLKRGIIDSTKIWKWHQDVVNGKTSRKSGCIILLDSMGNEKQRWRFNQAYPTKWSGPELKADGNDVEIESLELVHEGIRSA